MRHWQGLRKKLGLTRLGWWADPHLVPPWDYKKRIDKARIKNSMERLTNPGKIAIVYSQSQILIDLEMEGHR